MSDQERDQESIDNILLFVDALSPEGQDSLFEEMKLIWLRRAIDVGLEESERGDTISEEEMQARREVQRQNLL